jgi:hypothetical protein
MVWGRINLQPEVEVRGIGLSCRPKELAVARPAGCTDIDMVEIYELLREVWTGGIVATRGREVKRPWGHPRELKSRRRDVSDGMGSKLSDIKVNRVYFFILSQSKDH